MGVENKIGKVSWGQWFGGKSVYIQSFPYPTWERDVQPALGSHLGTPAILSQVFSQALGSTGHFLIEFTAVSWSCRAHMPVPHYPYGTQQVSNMFPFWSRSMNLSGYQSSERVQPSGTRGVSGSLVKRWIWKISMGAVMGQEKTNENIHGMYCWPFLVNFTSPRRPWQVYGSDLSFHRPPWVEYVLFVRRLCSACGMQWWKRYGPALKDLTVICEETLTFYHGTLK